MSNYSKIKHDLFNQKLIVVSKKRSIEQIQSYYDLGERSFGENRYDELIDKAKALPKDIEWHFIGHLQRNKVKYVLPYVSLIQSVESMELVQIIDKEAKKLNRIIPILIQFNFAKEDTKSGLPHNEAIPFITECLNYSHVQVKGIMCMGPHTEDISAIEHVFEEAHQCFLELQNHFGRDIITECSMGMSDDYNLAIQHGSTMVRIGSILFNEK
ncbi:YggS family pyridoxal phosphate-dependent enzyme [Anaerorhabdus sp.]|uniref:YggS family pyridoxal phosphate-dependent enzyme n=1 Tax=Anaerorhabdus sp. TaxID=1872524 RepID=UPI002FC8E543